MRIAVPLWLLCVASGMGGLMVYQNSPGTQATAPERWPPDAPLSRSSTDATLVMFAHPRCTCTRASVEELARLVALRPGRVEGLVLFYKPAGFENGWERTDLWRSAAAIPGVSVVDDEEGRLARLFGAETSGHVVLYDRNGTLRFRGGITASRGHAGDNVGRTKLMALLAEQEVTEPMTPVFGCPLTDSRACKGEAGRCTPSPKPNRS